MLVERFLHRDERFEHLLPVRTRPGELVRVEVGLTGGEPGARLYIERVALVERATPRPPSIIFVSVDTLSARETSVYGHARRTTPQLEAFARQAVRFENCRANAPWTVPSYMSQFSGLYPRAHELDRIGRVRSEWERRRLAPTRWTLPEALRARGYRTAAFVDNPWLSRGLGFEQGFEEFDASAAEIDWRDPRGGIDHIVPRVAAWLDERTGSEPFFLFVQAFDPHAPYNPTEPWKGTFADDDLGTRGATLPVGHGQRAANGCVRPVTIQALIEEPFPDVVPLDPIVAAYHEKVLQVDAGLGRLFLELRRRGLLDTSVVIVSADHGESLLLHDYHFGHSLLYDDVMHVPLLVRLPGADQGGRVVKEPVQLVDLYPTILELSGSRLRTNELHGRSLAPLLHDPDLARSSDAGTVYGEGGIAEQAFLVQEGWKLIVSFPSSGSIDWQWTHPRLDAERLRELAPELADRWPDADRIHSALEGNPELDRFLRTTLAGPVFELYDLGEDPNEQVDIAAGHPDVVHALFERLIEERLRGEAARAGARSLDAPEWTDTERARLDDLGYFGD